MPKFDNKEEELFLKPLDMIKKPFSKKIVGFDIETAGENNDFVMACFVGDNIDKTFLNKDELIKWINRHDLRNYYVIATNLGFDFLGCLYDNPKNWKICERSGHIYSFTYYQNGRKNHSVKFLDTINYYPAPVKKLGEILGIHKKGHPKCFKRNPDNYAELLELEEYCKNDAKISYLFFKTFIVEWIKQEKMKMKSTIASLSMDSFRRYYLKKSYTVATSDVHELVWKAYYGGRTEVFKRGTFENINCYDFNSLYPSVMLENEFPNPNTLKRLKQSSKFYVQEYKGISYVEGFMPSHYIPSLPSRIDGKLKFPAYQIKGYYTHAEINYAVQTQEFNITKYGDGIFYTKSEKIFEEFVKKNYAKRLLQKKNGNKMELMTKLLMNSLYGKFAFNYRESNSLIPKSQATMKMFDECSKFVEYGDYIEFFQEDVKKPCYYSFPEWSAYCTSYARIKLHKILSLKKIEDDIVYCDTDSVFLANNRKLPNSDELGALGFEYKAPVGVFVKPKFYCTDKPKVKGVRQLKDMNDFLEVLKNPRVMNERFIKYRTAIKSKMHHKHGVLTPNRIIQVKKELNLNDDKRVWFNKFNYKQIEDSAPVLI